MVEETSLLRDAATNSKNNGQGFRLSVLTTSIFLVGQTAGCGILALPAAMSDTGVIGFIIIAAGAIVSAYTGSILGKCLVIVQSRYEEYRDCPRYPYPAMGMVTYGKPGRLLVSFCINATCFGASVVYILMAVENIQQLAVSFNFDLSYCIWLCIIAAVLTPLAWFGTPKDFWPIALTASATPTIALILILTNMAMDASTTSKPSYKPIDVNGFLTALATIVFAFGGHPGYPTFQVDMKEPRKFGLVCILSYIVLICMFEPVAIAGYLVYGSAMDDNIILTLSDGILKQLSEILITIHLITAYQIVVNPVCQEGEELLGISHKFGLGRLMFRTAITGLALFVELSVPQFGTIMNFIGASTLTALVLLFPPIFYLKLTSMQGQWDKPEISQAERVALIMIIILGVLILVAATYSALLALVDYDFTVPCYL